jgi:4-diphosphocytidyl-2-C-methyl-D-erythritol kinase
MIKLDGPLREAHAKINLTLAVVGRRPDGYHEIESWMVPISWHDDLTFEKADCYSLVVTGQVPDVPCDGRNLVTRAHAALSKHVARLLPTRIELEKRVPTGAGLGGGSSDAAATLMGLNELWDLRLATEELMPLAAAIGSDVPFFLHDAQAIVTGCGEKVHRIVGYRDLFFVLIIPPFGVSTVAVYANVRGYRNVSDNMRPWETLPHPAAQLQHDLFNDLQATAFGVEPRLAELHRLVDGLDGQRVLMSGSGSTLYTIFNTPGHASTWEDRARAIVGDRAIVQSQSIVECPVRR